MVRDNLAQQTVNPGGLQSEVKSTRLEQAIQTLRLLSYEDISNVVWRRISGNGQTELPRLFRDEDPGDIFIDVYCAIENSHDYSTLIDYLRRACGDWLERVSRLEISSANSNDNIRAIGELTFVAARVGSEMSIAPLNRLAQVNIIAEEKMEHGELLRSRFLRALLGLIITYGRKERIFQTTFEKNLLSPQCELICFRALVGWFGADAETVRAKLQAAGIPLHEGFFNVHLVRAGQASFAFGAED